MRSLVNVEKWSNAVACPVLVVESCGPQWSSGQSIQTVTHCVAGKNGSAQGNVAFQYKRETLLLLLRGCAKGDCTSDVSSSIVVLCTRVTEVELLSRERPSSGWLWLVVDDSSIWTRRWDGRKTQRHIVRLLSNIKHNTKSYCEFHHQSIV